VDHDILHVGEFRFSVLRDKASLHALISNATDFKLYWMVNVPCEGADVELGGETYYFWQPKVHHESMTFSCRNWKELQGQHYHSTADDDDPAAIYLYQHLKLDRSDLHFVSRHGILFDIDWKFAWSGRMGMVRTTVTFTEVTVWLDEVTDEAAAKRRLQQDLDLSDLAGPEVVLHPSAGPRFKFRPTP
jgi:hypothetical protein